MTSTPLEAFIQQLVDVVRLAYPIAFGLVFIAFFLGIAVVLGQASGEKVAERAKRYLPWAVGALFVFVTVWGIVQLLALLFGVPLPTQESGIPVPFLRWSG